jgi:hypothetical protein
MQVAPSGHENGSDGSQPARVAHQQPSSMQMHSEPGGHDRGSPGTHSSLGWQ